MTMNDLKLVTVRASTILGVLGLSIFASYGMTRVWWGRPVPTPAAAAGTRASTKNPFPSGRYLITYVLVADECGFCSDPATKNAIGRIRASLFATQGNGYADIRVIGVAIDKDIDAGIRYLRSLGRPGVVLDEISVGRSWLNEFFTALVWRNGMGKPMVPQVLIVERHVDATGYPGNIDMPRDSLVLRVEGSDQLIAWVNQRTPLDFRPAPRGALSAPRR